MRWPGRRRIKGDSHIVDKGSVWCPVRRSDVELDFCFTCRAFQDLACDGHRQILHCRPTATPIEFEGYPIVL